MGAVPVYLSKVYDRRSIMTIGLTGFIDKTDLMQDLREAKQGIL